MNKKGYVTQAMGFILSLTLGQAIVIVVLIWIMYQAGKFGLFG